MGKCECMLSSVFLSLRFFLCLYRSVSILLSLFLISVYSFSFFLCFHFLSSFLSAFLLIMQQLSRWHTFSPFSDFLALVSFKQVQKFRTNLSKTFLGNSFIRRLKNTNQTILYDLTYFF